MALSQPPISGRVARESPALHSLPIALSIARTGRSPAPAAGLPATPLLEQQVQVPHSCIYHGFHSASSGTIRENQRLDMVTTTRTCHVLQCGGRKPAPRPFSRDSARLAALLDMFSRGSTVGSHGGVVALWQSLQHLHPGVDWTGVSATQVPSQRHLTGATCVRLLDQQHSVAACKCVLNAMLSSSPPQLCVHGPYAFQVCDVQAMDETGASCVQVAAWINNTRTRLQQGGRPPGGRLHRTVPAGGPPADLALSPAPISELGRGARVDGMGTAAPQRAEVGAQLASDRIGVQQLHRPTLPLDGSAHLGAAGQTLVQNNSGSAQQQQQQQLEQQQPRGPPQAAQPEFTPSPAQDAGTWQPLPGQAWQQGTLRTGRPYLGAVPYAPPQSGPQKRRRGKQ